MSVRASRLVTARDRHCSRRTPAWAKRGVAVGLVALTVGTASCTASSSPSGPTSAAPSIGATSFSAHSSPTGPAACPNKEGGLCLGELTANHTYTTQLFTPDLSYRVSVPDWSNYGDTPGNFLLVPPKNDLPGVNAGTADFLGVYTAITPSRITQRVGCATEPIAGSGASPQAMATFVSATARPHRVQAEQSPDRRTQRTRSRHAHQARRQAHQLPRRRQQDPAGRPVQRRFTVLFGPRRDPRHDDALVSPLLWRGGPRGGTR